MDPFKKRDELRAEAKALRDALAAENRSMTAEEAERVKALNVELTEVEAKCSDIEAQTKALAAFVNLEGERSDEEGPTAKGTKGIGEMFVESAAYKAWAKDHPSGVGQGSNISIKAGRVGALQELKTLLTSPLGHAQPMRYPTVDLAPAAQPTFLDLITRGQADGAFEYLQITAVTNNAAIVPEATSSAVIGAGEGQVTAAAGGLKPTSSLSTNLADAKPVTYADGYEATNQMLRDAKAIATYLNARLGQNIRLVVEDKLLNGSGENGEPLGLVETSGVLQQDFATDFMVSVRKAITQLQKVPGFMRISGVVVSPDDDEAWDLKQDDNHRYIGAGPFASGIKTAWGYPRIVSTKVPTGTAVVGDLSTIALLDVDGLSIEAFNQHKDFAQRNLTYVRAELRAEQAIFEPARLCLVSTSAA